MAAFHDKFEIWFGKFASLVYDRKFAALACILLLTAGLGSQLSKITIDTRDEAFFYEDDPALIAYNAFRDRFGQDDTFIVALQPQAGFDRDFLAILHRVHTDLEESVPYLDEITSLVNGRIVRGEDDALIVGKLMEEPPQTSAEMARFRGLVDHYPLYEQLLISKDRSLATILIKARAVREVEPGNLFTGFEEEISPVDGRKYLSNDESLEITKAVKDVLARYQGQGMDLYFSGTPVVIAELQLAIERDLGRIIPLSLFLIMFFLGTLFRRVSGVVYPLIVVFLSLIATMGIMAIADMPITLVTQILPSFLLIVGIADSVHVLTIFYRLHRQSRDKRAAIIEAMQVTGLPVLMTSVTTAFGLLSFVWADVASVGQMGIAAPAGVMLAFLYTIVLLPALIAVLPVKPRQSVPEKGIPMADKVFTAIARFTTGRPFLVSTMAGIIVAVALTAALSVRFSHNALTWFPEDSPIRTATKVLDEVNGGSVMLEVLVDSGKKAGFHEPDLLTRLDLAAMAIPGLEVDGIRAAKAWSLADVLKETNRALNEDRDEAYAVPGNRELIAQELILFEASGSDDLEDFTVPDFQTARISVLAPFRDAVLFMNYLEQLKKQLESFFPTETLTFTGKIPLFVKAIKNIITSMVKSYVFAILVITLLMVALVGRIRLGLMSMVANVTPIIAVLGVMGWRHIPLDLSTILIGSLVLGLVVDDTIHFLHHFRRAYERVGNVEEAVRATLFSTGRAMLITSLVLSSGFFIYTVAYLENNVRYGFLSGCAILFALAADFFLVPALLSLVYGKAGKEVVR